MPIFEFKCKECDKEYEELIRKTNEAEQEAEIKEVECPFCKSKEKYKLVSMVSEAVFGNPMGTDKWSSHDYRFKHALPGAKAQRAAAEKKLKDQSLKNPYE